MRTAEIRAYNYGGKVKAAGFGLAALTEFEMTYEAVPFDHFEAEAAGELREGEFIRWAVRGWIESGRDGSP